MGTAANVKLGVCNVTFGGTDLGYTKGGVKVSYSVETVEKTVDQEDAPIDEIITKQKFEVKIPLAEHNLAILENLLPGATLVTDNITPTKKKLTLSGAAGASLVTMAKELVISPTGIENDNEDITLKYAIPKANLEFAFEKEHVRVYEVTFSALKGENGFVIFGDPTASTT